jgi:alpha-L-fucosidase 2
MKILRYKRPAKKWIDALPLGNGLTGAMVYGGIKKERIAFNNSSLWSGRPKKHDNEESLAYLDEVRSLIFKGENHLADKLTEENLTARIAKDIFRLGN